MTVSFWLVRQVGSQEIYTKDITNFRGFVVPIAYPFPVAFFCQYVLVDLHAQRIAALGGGLIPPHCGFLSASEKIKAAPLVNGHRFIILSLSITGLCCLSSPVGIKGDFIHQVHRFGITLLS